MCVFGHYIWLFVHGGLMKHLFILFRLCVTLHVCFIYAVFFFSEHMLSFVDYASWSMSVRVYNIFCLEHVSVHPFFFPAYYAFLVCMIVVYISFSVLCMSACDCGFYCLYYPFLLLD